MITIMDIFIQKATEIDFLTTENITREAFWNVYRPGCVEHLILQNLRNSKSYIKELDLVAVVEKKITGHILTTSAKIVDVHGNEHEILCVGPLSVLPDFQKKGIGSMLLKHSIQAAKELGYSGMILFGNPDYYHPFGFKNAQEYGISTKEDQNFESFMALELQNNGLDIFKGKFFEDNAFEINPDELIEFEKKFIHKEKLITDTQFEH
jgi:predicted N-acetyltransferase YhbS